MAKKKPRRGRPPKTGGKKTATIHIMCTPEAKDHYREAAARKGMDLAEWIRRVCDAASDQG